MTTKTPTPVPAPAPAPVPRATATSANPVTPGQAATPTPTVPRPSGPLDTAPAPVTRAQATTPVPLPAVPTGPIDRSPGAVIAGPGTGTSGNATVTITVPVEEIQLDIGVIPNTSGSNNVVVTTTKPGGENLSIQFNSSGTFGGSANLTFDGRSVYVGYNIPLLTTVQSSMSGGIINATGELRAGNIQLTPSNRNGYARLRAQNAASGSGAATANVYGFRTKNDQFVSLTNENGGLATTALILGGTPPYDAEATGNSTAFGISSTLYGTASQGIPSTGSTGENWRTLLNLTGRGELTIGGNITMSPPAFRPWAPSNANVGIRFADGTFQSTAATGGGGNIAVFDETTLVTSNVSTFVFQGNGVAVGQVGDETYVEINGGVGTIAIQDEGSNVVASANTVNFVGTGVTASNVGGVATVTINTTNVNTVYDAGSANTVTLNYNNGQWQNYSPSGDTVDITVSNIPTGGEMTIFLQTGAANTAIAWHAATVYFWEGGVAEPSLTSGARDVVTIKNNGNYYFAKFSKGYAP